MIVERVKNTDRCKLTVYGEKVAARVIASTTGIPVAEKLNLFLKEANSRPPTINDFAVNLVLPAKPSSHELGPRSEQIEFHKRRRIRELDDYNKSLILTGSEIRSIMENLVNLSSTKVRVAGASFRTELSYGWEMLCSVPVKFLPPATEPGLNPNDWQQRARRKFEIESTFEGPTIELPPWFE